MKCKQCKCCFICYDKGTNEPVGKKPNIFKFWCSTNECICNECEQEIMKRSKRYISCITVKVTDKEAIALSL